MNNEQFRRLIQDNSRSPAAHSPKGSQDAEGKTPILGSRARSSIPMTPRAVSKSTASADFSRQVADYKSQHGDGAPPSKRFRSSAAPKGTKLANGYVDRAALRKADQADQPPTPVSEEDEDKRKRLKALEEMVKLGQMDRAAFLQVLKEMGFEASGEEVPRLAGLDFKLLERTRDGDATQDEEKADQTLTEPIKPDEDFESALDKKAEEDVVPVQREVQMKKGTMAPPAPLTSSQAQKMSRDEILRRLKASRSATTQERAIEPQDSQEPTLGAKFKKISGSEKKRWIETDTSGRRKEILLTIDRAGNSKRKVRWLDKEPAAGKGEDQSPTAQFPVGRREVMGMEVPAELLAKQKALQEQQLADEEGDDIFAGVGTEYNPLGDAGDDDDDSDGSGSEEGAASEKAADSEVQEKTRPASATATKRNYFATSTTVTTEESSQSDNPLSSDTTIRAALKRAAALRQSESKDNEPGTNDTDHTDPVVSDRHQQFLEKLRKRDREDAADLDMGFGESRFGDEEDEDGPLWDEGEKKSGRKRGAKKRKGDKDSVHDVMSVLAGRSKDKS